MAATISIDTGGTFTDGYFTREGERGRVKVDTTPHDLTECLAKCIAAGAKVVGYDDATELLLDAEAIRFSSTIGTNSIIQRTGPRIGLLVSAGAAADLYGDGPSSLLGFMVEPSLVREIDDPLDEEQVRSRVRELLVGGPRIIVVSLAGSDLDPSGEQSVKRTIQRDYPRHYLGSVPCLLASEVTPRPGDERRTATAVVNAYLHTDMVRVLYKADEDLRSEGAVRPLLIVHASGAVARVAKTRAIETYNSGPVGGVYGSVAMARQYDLPAVVTIDVGGTSTDTTVVVDQQLPVEPDPTVAGIPVYSPMVRVRAVGGGGGSIARRDGEGYRVGPDSVGAAPGPACYALGGTQPTATDAEVVLGHLDPDWFLAGRRRLDVDRARAAIASIAGDDPIEEAAHGVHMALVSVAADVVSRSLEAQAVDPSAAVLFAFGGGGGLYSVDVARACGIGRVFAFENSSVFSAAGLSNMDIGHVYELMTGPDLDDRIDEIRRRAELDAVGEGFDPADLEFQLEIETDEGTLEIVGLDDQTAANGPSRPARVRAWLPAPPVELALHDVGPADPSAAEKAPRSIYQPGGQVTARVFDREKLTPGNVVEGPALVEAVDTTIVVPEGAALEIDQFGTGVIEVNQ